MTGLWLAGIPVVVFVAFTLLQLVMRLSDGDEWWRFPAFMTLAMTLTAASFASCWTLLLLAAGVIP